MHRQHLGPRPDRRPLQPLPAGRQLRPPVLPPQRPRPRRLRRLPQRPARHRAAGGGCADPGSTGQPVLRAGAWDDAFKPLRAGTGVCLDAKGGDTLNDTALIGWDCTGTRNQGWWQSPDTGTVHIETTHDRCLDVPGADYRATAPSSSTTALPAQPEVHPHRHHPAPHRRPEPLRHPDRQEHPGPPPELRRLGRAESGVTPGLG
ncbi:RICIN domain-containing protein [Actinomadura keratinilytica]